MFETRQNTIKSIDYGGYEVHHKLTVKYFLDEGIENSFNIDKWNVDPLADLFYYFTGNVAECEKRGNSLSKGIMLCGGIGSGKTKIMQAYKRYTGDFLRCNSFQYFRSAEIVESAKVDQTEYLRKFGIENPITCYIDDIAAKNEKAKIYGTDINPIEEVLNARYVLFQNTGKLTHVSCNLTISMLQNQKVYGERTIDRMREMFNIILLNGNSRRK